MIKKRTFLCWGVSVFFVSIFFVLVRRNILRLYFFLGLAIEFVKFFLLADTACRVPTFGRVVLLF